MKNKRIIKVQGVLFSTKYFGIPFVHIVQKIYTSTQHTNLTAHFTGTIHLTFQYDQTRTFSDVSKQSVIFDTSHNYKVTIVIISNLFYKC